MNVRDNAGRLESELRSLHERIEKTEKERAQSAELAKAASAERREAADDAKAFEAAEKKAARHRSEVKRLGLVLERLQLDVADHEHRIAHAKFADAYVTLTACADRQHAAGERVATHLAAAVKALDALGAARDEYDAADADARARCPDDVDFKLPENADEPAFPDGAKRLAEAIKAGPRQPLAKTAAGIERARRDGESTVRTHGYQAAREAIVDGDFERLGRITPEERRAAVASAEELAHSMPTSERAAKVAERRLERVREIVAEAAQVEAAA